MRVIQVRNVPDDVHRELQTRAAVAGISLSEFALAELERVARRPAVAEVLARASTRARSIETRAIVDAVREGRGRD